MGTRLASQCRALLGALLACLALGVPSVADARIETLRWQNTDPDPARIDGYVVHTGPSSGTYDTQIPVGLPAADPGGVYSYDLVVDDDAVVYVALTATDGVQESAFSNEQILAPEVVPSANDVTAAAGVDYLQLDYAQLEASRPTSVTGAELMTGGAAARDYDGDGWVDLYVTRLDAPDLLFRNRGDGTFEDVTVQAGLDLDLASNGAAWGDIDNDGDPDLYVTTLGPDASRFYLFINDGRGAFTEEAVRRGAAVDGNDPHFGFSVTFGDYDLDGWLDIHTTEWRSDADNPQGARSNARLLRNLGSEAPGFFEDVTDAAGVALDDVPTTDPDVAGTFALSSRFADLDGDGWPDLLVAGDYGTSRLFWNEGDGTFSDGTLAAGVGTEEHGTGSAVGDYDGDGLLDWFVTSIFDPCDPGDPSCSGGTGNRLYRNEGDGTFSDQTDRAGVRDGFFGTGTAFYDLENDGDLDLVMTNGDLTGSDPESESADPTRVWQNDGTGVMTEVSEQVGMTYDGAGRGLLTFDYDNDGDLDLFVVNNSDHSVLYRNENGNENDWLRVETRGTDSNRDGIGAVVTLWTEQGAAPQVREIDAGSHFLGQSDTTAHFGLGQGSAPVYWVEVYWPATQRKNEFFGPQRNSTLLAVEPAAEAPPEPAEDSGGGGACGLLGVEPLLLLAWLARRQHRKRRCAASSPRSGGGRRELSSAGSRDPG